MKRSRKKKARREARRVHRVGRRRAEGGWGVVLAQTRRTMKRGPVKSWVDTSQRFQSLGDEGGWIGVSGGADGRWEDLLDGRCGRAGTWPGDELMLMAGEPRPWLPCFPTFGRSVSASSFAAWVGLSGGSVARTVEPERGRKGSGVRRPGSGSTTSVESSSSFSTSTMGKVMARRKTLGAATMPSIFSHMFLSFHEYIVGKRVELKISGVGKILYGHHFKGFSSGVW